MMHVVINAANISYGAVCLCSYYGTSCSHLNSAVPQFSTALEMPIEVRPKSKHPSMKKARGGDRFDALESESLLPPALR